MEAYRVKQVKWYWIDGCETDTPTYEVLNAEDEAVCTTDRLGHARMIANALNERVKK